MKMKNLAVLTSGGDSPGMNACIRAIVRSANHKKISVHGIWYHLEQVLKYSHCITFCSLSLIFSSLKIVYTHWCKNVCKTDVKLVNFDTIAIRIPTGRVTVRFGLLVG